MPQMPTLHAIVRGRVQGVGFRYFTEWEASSRGLSGWVRNLHSGEVEIAASGPREELERFLRQVTQGPPLSAVRGVEAEWTEEELSEPFHIR
jgi:acylphosphatase